jgi:WD40 repeat protein
LTSCPKKSAFAIFQPLRERILSVYESFLTLQSDNYSLIKTNDMKTRRILTLIAVFATLFTACGNADKENFSEFKCLKTLEGHSHSVHSVCWSPDGKYLASGSSDRTVKIWDANSGE